MGWRFCGGAWRGGDVEPSAANGAALVFGDPGCAGAAVCVGWWEAVRDASVSSREPQVSGVRELGEHVWSGSQPGPRFVAKLTGHRAAGKQQILRLHSSAARSHFAQDDNSKVRTLT